jgi:hypothetical protein
MFRMSQGYICSRQMASEACSLGRHYCQACLWLGSHTMPGTTQAQGDLPDTSFLLSNSFMTACRLRGYAKFAHLPAMVDCW